MRRWMALTVLLLPATLLIWLKHAGGQTSYSAAIYRPDGSQSLPAPSADANQDAWPDDPFATLNDGDLWLASYATRTVAALRWSGSASTTQTIDLDLLRTGSSTQRLLVVAPTSLVGAGEILVLLVGVAPDLESLLDESTALPPDRTLLPGAQYIEISVLISPDNGETFDEIDPARLAGSPIRLRIEDITVGVDTIPVLYEHATYIDSDTKFGLTPLAESGEWAPVSCITLPHEDRALSDATYPAYIEADLHSLSVFAPTVPLEDEGGGSGSGEGADEDSPNSGDEPNSLNNHGTLSGESGFAESDGIAQPSGFDEEDGGGFALLRVQKFMWTLST